MASQHLRIMTCAALGAICLMPRLDMATASEPGRGAGQKKWVVNSDDLIQKALTNNLDILISRIQPQQDQFSLNGLYSAYEPAIGVSATHNYNESPGGLFAEIGYEFQPITQRINNYQLGLGGAGGGNVLTPWGTSYSITGPVSQQNQTGYPQIYTASPQVSLSQPLLKNAWIDNTRLQIAVSKKQLKIDQLALRLQIMTVVNNVKAAYYTLISDRENVKVEESAVQLAEETTREQLEKMRVGALAPFDEKQAESQAATARSALLTAQATQAAQENVLKNLVGVALGQWEDFSPVPSEQLVAVPENPHLLECFRIGLEKRPDILQARLKIEQQHVTVKYRFNQLFPELDLTGTYGRGATSATFDQALGSIREGTYPNYSYGLALTVPLGNTGPRNSYKSDKAQLELLLLQAKKTERTIVQNIDTDIKKIQSDYLSVDSTRKARQYAEEALSAEQTKLEHGKSTSFNVLQLQNSLTSARLQEIQALATYNIDLETLAFDDGTTLEWNHIDLRVR